MIIVDTSVLIDFFRSVQTKATEYLEQLDRQGTPFFIPMICCQEILQGSKNEREWKLLIENLTTQRLLSSSNPWHTHSGGAKLFYECKKKGIAIRSTVDCWIAQLVLECNGSLLHNDVDFEQLKRVCDLETLYWKR